MGKGTRSLIRNFNNIPKNLLNYIIFQLSKTPWLILCELVKAVRKSLLNMLSKSYSYHFSKNDNGQLKLKVILYCTPINKAQMNDTYVGNFKFEKRKRKDLPPSPHPPLPKNSF